MGAGRPIDPGRQARRQQADGQPARGSQRPHVHPEHGLPMGRDPQGPAAAQHPARLLRPMGRRRHARAHSPRALCGMPGVGGARRQPERCDHRSPERQERRKRGRRIDPPGYDGGKKIRGKKRHVLVDTEGLLLQALVHAADIQDRDGGVLLMATLFGLHPFLLKLYADGGYQGPQFQGGLRRIMRQVDVEIVKRSDAAKGFTVLPKRWRLLSGSGVVTGTSGDKARDEGAEESFAPAARVVYELEEAEVVRQLLLRDAPMRAEPRAQQRPETLDRVDVHLAEPVPVLVAGVFAAPVTDRLVLVAPGWQAGVDTILVGVDEGALSNGGRDDRLDRDLLHVGQHAQHHLATTLDQAENGWLVLLQRAPARRAGQPATASEPPLLTTAPGWPLCPATT